MGKRELRGIVTLPYVTPSGRLVASPGWDAETGLYLDLPLDWQPRVPDKPTPEQVREAAPVMMRPLSAYQWADANSAAGMVSGVLTTVARPAIDIAPGYLIEAAAPGSGKTRAALALGAIITGQRVGVVPYTSGANAEDEVRKRLLAAALAGEPFTCIDNITGYYKSPSMAAALTSPRITDRLLGVSETRNPYWRALVTFTGNNATVDADLARRMVKVRIDSGAAPTQRVFDFDPVTAALTHRRRIAVAACTVQRAYLAAGAPVIIRGDAGGFADWDRLCRQPVLWLQEAGLLDRLGWEIGDWTTDQRGLLADPAASMLADASASDPELEALHGLLGAMWALSQGEPFTSREALQWFRDGEASGANPAAAEVHSAVVDLMGRQGARELTARSMGRLMANRKDRVVGGFALRVLGADASRLYKIVRVGGSQKSGKSTEAFLG